MPQAPAIRVPTTPHYCSHLAEKARGDPVKETASVPDAGRVRAEGAEVLAGQRRGVVVQLDLHPAELTPA